MSYAADKAKRRADRKHRRRSRRAEVEKVLSRAGTLERIASRISEDDQSRAELLRVSRDVLSDLDPVPVSVAAPLLGVSEPTVRSWTRRGLLVYADGQGSGLDVRRLYEVLAFVRELRDAGQTHDLLNKVWHRLADSAVLERPDLRDSLAQMRRGDGIPTDIDELERDLGTAD
jgi:DNA-binding transcriptional MerR regulator